MDVVSGYGVWNAWYTGRHSVTTVLAAEEGETWIVLCQTMGQLLEPLEVIVTRSICGSHESQDALSLQQEIRLPHRRTEDSKGE